jgi:hypothetical protein
VHALEKKREKRGEGIRDRLGRAEVGQEKESQGLEHMMRVE